MLKNESVENQKEYHLFSKKEINQAIKDIKEINQQITKRNEQLKVFETRNESSQTTSSLDSFESTLIEVDL